ncbi:adenine-specific DNA-methyltransferase [Amaricoccus macauensis]|uniref:site-specific DNA-methyltransferase (adenine-specific) n=1 Tax=Amaricoccus macauensis TaxID=57001 RepID=A0A840SS99_9RHOB|nr:site-specific DNA-methyltransferase [Amaricoccus macauensis]MBB5223425.1 adenine-specific DNA-methyltransferase [Amaricoccus macauensis]
MTENAPAGTRVESITHDDRRANIPSAELESVLADVDRAPIRTAWERRDPDLDPQLVWRGKDLADWSDLIVQAPPIYLQEQIHPKALIENLRASLREGRVGGPDLFEHFGLTDDDREAEVEFYRHSRKWSNRMILGDSLAVMASLAEREGLRGQVQAIYIDPPYGIRFNSNFQWSTTSRDVKDGNLGHLTREPEQVKAFRDTWRDGIHSYLTYLRDRLTIARELLTESGSCFVQIGDENVHRVRAVMDEVFGEENFVSEIIFAKTSSATTNALPTTSDFILWYARNREAVKYRNQAAPKRLDGEGGGEYRSVLFADGATRRLSDEEIAGSVSLPNEGRVFRLDTVTSQSPGTKYDVPLSGFRFYPSGYWKTDSERMGRLIRAGRMVPRANSLGYLRFFDDYAVVGFSNVWSDTQIAGRPGDKIYVVQTLPKVITRCLLMTTDPGDLVLDPTCGSGTTAFVAEQWGRRWITIDTSRVALVLARARIMGAKFPFYLLADSPEGRAKEAQITRTPPPDTPTHNDIRQGFVYERVPHITLKSIANNAEIDVIWAKRQPAVQRALIELNAALEGHPVEFLLTTGARAGRKIDFTMHFSETLPSGEKVPANDLLEWEVPRTEPDDWPVLAKVAVREFWEARIARQKEIDASIAARAEFEYLYNKPYEDRKRIRVAGPFTVESLSPHRAAAVGANGELIDELDASRSLHSREAEAEAESYVEAILENLRRAGVHQKDKGDRIAFTALKPWPGELVCAEGRYPEGDPDAPVERRAAIFIGPEYGTVQRADLVAVAREAAEAGFDVVIACAFNFDAQPPSSIVSAASRCCRPG